MKTKKLFTRLGVASRAAWVLPALIALLNLIPAGTVTAQTFTTLHSFTATSTNSSGVYTNGDGATPYAGLITNSSGNTLYGTASRGGSSGNGTVFAVNTDGTSFTNLHDFAGYPSDGAYPYAGLVLSGNILYGTTVVGGGFGAGTVFGVNTGGTGFTILWTFKPIIGSGQRECASSYDCLFILNSECAKCVAGPRGFVCVLPPGNCRGDTYGSYPYAGLILSGTTLYGAAVGGGNTPGTVFAVGPGGGLRRNVYSFGTHFGSGIPGPRAGMILSGDTLYGTRFSTVIAVNTDGTGFRNLYDFTGGSDGAGPVAGLITNSSGTTLYGTAWSGGSFGNGAVFAVNTDGTGFTNLHSFAASSTNSSGTYTNSDGANPQAGLILSGNTLYGTASVGGSSGKGTVFALNTDGTGFTNLHSFTAWATNSSGVETNGEGANPYAGLILSGNTLYGTASAGGSSGNGTVFSLSFRPQLTITRSSTDIVLSWPTNVAGFDYTGYTLQSAATLTGTFTNLPAGMSPYAKAIAGPQQFFRLSQ
jgi:uncharacterized repeat protein (TIGR03803 family)